MTGCDMPRGAAEWALIRGFPNGETRPLCDNRQVLRARGRGIGCSASDGVEKSDKMSC